MKVVIAGGGAGGASAATRCRRLSEDAEIILFESGKYISLANCGFPYYIGGEIKNRKNLFRASPALFLNRYNIKVHILSEVTSIDRKRKSVTVRNVKNDSYINESYDKLILSPGAEPIKLRVPGMDSNHIFVLRNIFDMDAINEAITAYRANKVIIIGGGFIGLEMAENCKKRGLKVGVVEMLDQVMNIFDKEMVTPIHNHLKEKEIKIFLNSEVESFKPSNSGIIVKLKDGEELLADIVILSLGVVPESKLAIECGLEIGVRNSVRVNKYMQTSNSNIYAIGDVVEVRQFVNNHYSHIPLAGPAVRQARVAADHIFGRNTSFRGSQGTCVCKIFDFTVAATGLNEKNLKELNIAYEKIYIYDHQHVDYYPGATPILLKLIFDKDSGKILGAQAVGKEGVDKRIDVISLAIQGGMKVFDLEESELNYAPPYGAPKDIINMAGFAASNIMRGDVKITHWDSLEEIKKENSFLLDVRSPLEFELGNVEGATNIHVNVLRQNIDKLEKHKNKKIYVYCLTGYRSYVACRILTQLRFNAVNISGGYILYKCFYPKGGT